MNDRADGDLAPVDPGQLAALAYFSSATLHEAMGRIGALPAAIKPIDRDIRLCGPAFPVFCPAGDNLMIHKAIKAAAPGEILVVDHEASMSDGPFGDVLAEACLARAIAGLIIDGCVRDATTLRTMGFPVFARGLCIEGTDKLRTSPLGAPITLGNTTIHRGDLVVGDEDGVVIVPRAMISAAVDAAREREEKEDALRAALRAGRTTMDLLGLRDR
ncbi:demethylmenaquinone methyltransferase [Rhizobium albus]|nr:demethylmenaquinone methyltransferase [Rhizobium albus]